jgi:hypothetical protein
MHVNEGNNVTTSMKFWYAVLKSNIKNVKIVSASPDGVFQKNLPKIKDATTLNNTVSPRFSSSLAFEQYQIGNGVYFQTSMCIQSIILSTFLPRTTLLKSLKKKRETQT